MHGHISVGQATKTYINQLCTDTGCRLEVLLNTKTDRDGWPERDREKKKSILLPDLDDNCRKN